MEKYEINIVYGEDKTKFNISKSSSIEKLKNFIEMYYEELKNERYEIIYNDINLKLIAKTETLQNVFAKENGMINLSGHRSIGGMRASIYNAMPKEGVAALVDFMRKFEEENK